MNIISRINDLLAQAHLFCLATVIASADEKITVGHKVVILPDGAIEYGTGQPAADEQICSYARACLNTQKRQVAEIQPGLLVFYDISMEFVVATSGQGTCAHPCPFHQATRLCTRFSMTGQEVRLATRRS